MASSPKPLRAKHDFSQFLKVLRREGQPSHLPFYEHVVTASFIDRRLGIAWSQMTPADPDYWKVYMDFWLSLGFDCIPMEIPLNCPLTFHEERKLSYGSESAAVITSDADFERYPWPDTSTPLDFSHFEKMGSLLPDGVKIVGGVCMGPYEWVSTLMGVQGLALSIYTNPQLVERMFEKFCELHTSAVRQLATMDVIGALRQGDDLGFKTSTFLNPNQLRQYIFPTYKLMTQAAHAQNKPFILHSCGNLEEVYNDLIDDVGIDAKHSFEDVIMPVGKFKQQYGHRVTPLGGLDVDVICRSNERDLRAYARKMIEACYVDGYWAMGTGNSLTDYMPVENYLVILDEGIKVSGE